MQITAELVLEWVQSVDPDARLQRTAWGTHMVVTTALISPTLLVLNPEVRVISDSRRKALGENL